MTDSDAVSDPPPGNRVGHDPGPLASLPPDAVVVTGRGAVTSHGVGVDVLLAAVADGVVSLGVPTVIGTSPTLAGPVGEVADLVPGDSALPRVVDMALLACREALAEASLTSTSGVDLLVGTASGSRSADDWHLVGVEPPAATIGDGGERFAVVTDQIQHALALDGRAVTINTACTSGANAIAHGWELLVTGRAVRVLCVGVEELWAGMYFSFRMMSMLSADPCQPYRRSVGTTLAEGAGAVVLERADAAGRRGATPLGVVLGVGQSGDAYHSVRPDPSAEGPRLAVDRALRAAAVTASAVELVCGHGTGTAANDDMEVALYGQVFGQATPLCGTKGSHGHTAGASAVIELIVLLECLRGSYQPAATCWHPDRAGAPAGGAGIGVKIALAGGGLNTSIAMAAPGATAARRSRRVRHGVVALGELAAAGSGHLEAVGPPSRATFVADDALAARLPAPVGAGRHPAVPRREWRRMDLLGKLVLGATALLLEGAGPGASFDDVGFAYATLRGPVLSWALTTDAMRTGRAINPRVIGRLSYNTAPSWACESFGLRGPTVAYTSGPDGGLHAFDHAVMVLELGLADAMVVVAADEYTGPGCTDDGLLRLGGVDPRDPVLDVTHQAIGQVDAMPAVGAILLARDDVTADYSAGLCVDVGGTAHDDLVDGAAVRVGDPRLQAAGCLVRLAAAVARPRPPAATVGTGPAAPVTQIEPVVP